MSRDTARKRNRADTAAEVTGPQWERRRDAHEIPLKGEAYAGQQDAVAQRTGAPLEASFRSSLDAELA
jgi:hypothetical protein